MHINKIEITCPHCEQQTLVGEKLYPLERVGEEFESYKVLGQFCECANSRTLQFVHTATDENGITEAIYEHSAIEYSRHPVFDRFFGMCSGIRL